LSGSLKRIFKINLGEEEEKRFQVFDPAKRVSFGIAWNEP
jgi:hypothetical protein